jgi:hypothetical protein
MNSLWLHIQPISDPRKQQILDPKFRICTSEVDE